MSNPIVTIEMENGGGVIALPACRAAGAALAAAGCGGQVLTLERDRTGAV